MHTRNPAKERYWRAVIQRQGRSGLRVRQFCIDAEVDESSFYHWRRELRMRDLERSRAVGQAATSNQNSPARHHNNSQATARSSARLPDPPMFVPIRLTEDRSPSLELQLECGATLRIPAGFDRDTLANVLEALERTRC
jgi:hypothetical protein